MTSHIPKKHRQVFALQKNFTIQNVFMKTIKLAVNNLFINYYYYYKNISVLILCYMAKYCDSHRNVFVVYDYEWILLLL